MHRLFRKLDVYGVRTEFFIGKASKFKSSLGGFLSLIFIFSALILFFLLGNDMITSRNPELVTSEVYNHQPSRSTVGKNGYFFIFGMENSNYQHFYDDSIYDVFLQNITIISNETGSITTVSDIPIERCSEDHLPADLKSYFLRVVKTPINNLICVKKGYEFDIEGSYDSLIHKYIFLNIKTCKNSTTKNTICQPQEVIEDILQQSYFAFYSNDYLIDARNLENPGTVIGRDYFVATTPNIRKGIVKYISTNHIISDESWIFNSEKRYNYTSYVNDKESFEIRSYNIGEETKTLCNMLIRKMNYEKVYTRKYKKIHNVFADMSGFLNILFMVLYLLTFKINSKLYYEALANILFNFEQGEEIWNKLHDQNLKAINMAKSILEESSEESNPIDSAKLKTQKEKILQQLFKNQGIPLKFSLWKSITAFFKKNNEFDNEAKQRDSAVNKIKENLDISYILKKIFEIEKLKLLLLDENQYYLFELLPKPLIRKNGTIQLNSNRMPLKNPGHNEVITSQDYTTQAKMIRNAYEIINSKEIKNEIDERLLMIIDEDLKNLFDETVKSSNTLKFGPEIREMKKTKFSFLPRPTEKNTTIENDILSIGSENVIDRKSMDSYC